MPPVLVHGDLWSFNILWYSEKNEKKIRFIIDWQVTLKLINYHITDKFDESAKYCLAQFQ